MDVYAVGILPLIVLIKPEVERRSMRHVAYADALAGGSWLHIRTRRPLRYVERFKRYKSIQNCETN